MGGYLRAMRRYAVFGGRASRAEFWQFTAVLVGLAIVTLIIDGIVSKDQGKQDEVFTALLILAHLVPAFAVTVRRLHDADRSGWLVLLNYIPPLNLIIIAFACQRGTPGPNRYGPDPLDPMAVATTASTGIQAGTTPANAVPSPAAPMRSDLIAELERLGRLRKDGHLNDAEFEVMKAEALAQGRR